MPPDPAPAVTQAPLARILGTADLAFTAVGIVIVLSGVPAYFWWRRQKMVRTTTGFPTPSHDSA